MKQITRETFVPETLVEHLPSKSLFKLIEATDDHFTAKPVFPRPSGPEALERFGWEFASSFVEPSPEIVREFEAAVRTPTPEAQPPAAPISPTAPVPEGGPMAAKKKAAPKKSKVKASKKKTSKAAKVPKAAKAATAPAETKAPETPAAPTVRLKKDGTPAKKPGRKPGKKSVNGTPAAKSERNRPMVQTVKIAIPAGSGHPALSVVISDKGIVIKGAQVRGKGGLRLDWKRVQSVQNVMRFIDGSMKLPIH